MKCLITMVTVIFILAAGAARTGSPTAGKGGGEIPEDWEKAETGEAYLAWNMWMSDAEGKVKLFDREENETELEKGMRFAGGSVLETGEKSLAAVDMDRERLAILDEETRTAFDEADRGSRIGLTLQQGALYFRVGKPLEGEESFEITVRDIRLAIRGTCGLVQVKEDGVLIVLASGHAVITPGTEAETGEITVDAGESVFLEEAEAGGGIRYEKKRIPEDEVPAFLLQALDRDPEQLEKVCTETGWQTEALFGDRFYMDCYEDNLRRLLEHDKWDVDRYALVYLTEEDTVPSLLVVDDTDGWFNIFHYDPESREVKEYYFTMHGMPHAFYTHENGKGLSCRFRTEDGKLSINVAVWSEDGNPAYRGKYYGDDDKGTFWYLQKEINWTYVE